MLNKDTGHRAIVSEEGALLGAPSFRGRSIHGARCLAGRVSPVLLCVVVTLGCSGGAAPIKAEAQQAMGGAGALAPVYLDEAVSITARLIELGAQNPPGDEGKVAAFLESRIAGLPIEVQRAVFDEAGRRENILLKLRRSGAGAADAGPGPVLLVGHSDVVPADPAEWAFDPFAATTRGDDLLGRGALDMLSMVALEVTALMALANSDIPRARDVWVLIAGDEEVDGLGMKKALTDWPELATAAIAINEGGYILEGFFEAGHDVAGVSVGEKGLFQFRLETAGKSGHGSQPGDDDAPAHVLRAASSVLARPWTPQFTPESELMFAALGQARGGVGGFVMQHPALLGTIGKETLSERKALRALVSNSCALTVLKAGYKRNVIPASAAATFDCRILPGTDPTRFRNEILLAIDDPKVTMHMEQTFPANGSSPDALFLDLVAALFAEASPPVPVVPILTPGTTDSRFLRRVGVPSYGFVPIRVTADELESIHGKNETVRVSELKKGMERMWRLVAGMAQTTASLAPRPGP